ncbi:MAG: hypothetical protein CVT63_01055 [Candidatus Anoxymicrobium japonicum]|uniref:Lipoprotein n=1 Tax=Candidatus Anoxymicrobium japonicum TaxID=2013648 RepID=A0A2N3G7V9_9ACTN|nr:MAG: hypothetical protein CVT63_01055 [Candidatus Anoxymicrobium japonicum]
MNTNSQREAAARATCVLLMLAILVPALVLLAGCGGNTPEGAVRGHLNAWQSLNWEAYKKTVNPEKKLTKDQEELAKQKFKQIQVKFQDLKMQTGLDPKDKNRATVTIVSGKAIYTATILGKKKTDTQDITKMDSRDRPTFDVVRMNGAWYVDTKLG